MAKYVSVPMITILCLSAMVFANFNVLWDTSHGVRLNETIGGIGFTPESGGYFNSLSQNLQSNGFSVGTTGLGNNFSSTNLAGVDIAVVAVTSSWDSEYSIDEITDIKNFVGNGGGLLIMADYNSNNSNIQALASEFGVGISSGNAFGLVTNSTITDFSDHSILEGVDQLMMTRGASELLLSGEATSVARHFTGKTMVAITEYGEGRVVIIGDNHLFTDLNGYYDIPDSQEFSLNTFNHLAAPVPEPATIAILSLGGLFVASNKKRRKN